MKQKHKVRLYECCVLAGLITAGAGYANEALLIAVGYVATDSLIAVYRRGHPLPTPPTSDEIDAEAEKHKRVSDDYSRLTDYS